MGLLTSIRDASRGITAARSPKWPAVEKAFLKANQGGCQACRAKSTLEVHHKQPFHMHPELELDPKNLIVLCRRCHLLVGHLDDWQSYNPSVKSDASDWAAKISLRP